LHGHEQEWARNAEARARATESRWMAEMQQKEELFQSTLRQRDQQWQVKLDALREELQAQTEQDVRRREVESADARLRALRELEARLRQEMQQKDEAAQAKAKQREQTWVAKLAAQAEAHQMAAQERQTELETISATIEPLKAQLVCAEKERDEARQSASEGDRQVQDLEEKLIEASSLLSGWNNGKNGGAARNQLTSPLAMVGRAQRRLPQE
jgi:chromosome segregation ATPase